MNNLGKNKGLGDLLEMKVMEVNLMKERTTTDEFLNETDARVLKHLGKIKEGMGEIDRIKKEIEVMSARADDFEYRYRDISHAGEVWLSDVIKSENPEFGSNNLILSPVGSGKTHFVENHLAPSGGKYQLMVVSNRHLKESLAPTGSNTKKREREGSNVFTTQDRTVYGDKSYSLHVMTYSELGLRLQNNNKFIEDNNITEIYCDEIHSLFEYIRYENNPPLEHASKFLFQKHEGRSIYYFTATTQTLDDKARSDKEKFENVEVFNYLDYPNIRKYINLSEYEINHYEQIRFHLRALSSDFRHYGFKGVAYDRKIQGQKRLAELLKEEGFKPLMLWSTSSEYEQMDAEQLRALDELVATERIPEGYNFLIVNSAMREGFNLFDDKIEVCVVNTTDKLSQVQVRGRIRKNISTFIAKTDSKELVDYSLNFPDEKLDTPIVKEERDELVQDYGIVNHNGKRLGWRAVAEVAGKSGYKVDSVRVTVDGKQVRATVITEVDGREVIRPDLLVVPMPVRFYKNGVQVDIKLGGK